MSKTKETTQIIVGKINDSKWTKLIMAGIIVVLIILNWNSCEARKNDKQQYEQNKEAFKKEIVVQENKNGDLQHSVVAYKGRVKDLNEYSEELSEEVKNLKRRKPKIITKTEIIYKDTNITIANNVVDTIGLDKDEYRLSWKYVNSDSTRFLEGSSVFSAKLDERLRIKPKYTKITRDELKLDFVVGVAENKKTGFDEIFVTPKNDNVTVGSLEGAILEKSKLGINLSFYVGYGLYYGDNKFGLAPSVGISISKPIIRF